MAAFVRLARYREPVTDVTLSPSDPLLRHRLENYAETLQARALDVELERPREERGMTPETAFVSLAIGIAGRNSQLQAGSVVRIMGSWPHLRSRLSAAVFCSITTTVSSRSGRGEAAGSFSALCGRISFHQNAQELITFFKA